MQDDARIQVYSSVAPRPYYIIKKYLQCHQSVSTEHYGSRGGSGFRRWRHAKKAETGIGIFRVIRVDGIPLFIIGHKHSIDNMDDAQIIRQLNGTRQNFLIVDPIDFRVCNSFKNSLSYFR
jgi:hypothetical protein